MLTLGREGTKAPHVIGGSMMKKKIVRLRRQDQLYVQIPAFIIILIVTTYMEINHTIPPL